MPEHLSSVCHSLFQSIVKMCLRSNACDASCGKAFDRPARHQCHPAGRYAFGTGCTYDSSKHAHRYPVIDTTLPDRVLHISPSSRSDAYRHGSMQIYKQEKIPLGKEGLPPRRIPLHLTIRYQQRIV